MSLEGDRLQHACMELHFCSHILCVYFSGLGTRISSFVSVNIELIFVNASACLCGSEGSGGSCSRLVWAIFYIPACIVV